LNKWTIENDSAIYSKRRAYNISELLAGSKYQKKFKGGISTHCYLCVYDYHRYHTSVGGKMVEVKKSLAEHGRMNAKKLLANKRLMI